MSPFTRLALSALALLTTPHQASRTTAPIALAVEDAAEPWSGPDGAGFANDIVRAAFAAEGIAVRLDVVPYARCKRMVVTGATAGCFSMSRDATIDASVVFPDTPVFTCRSALFARQDGPLLRTRTDALPRGTRVGMVLGYEYPDTVRALERRGTIVLEAAASDEINLRKLASGRLDAVLLNYNAIKPASWMTTSAGVDVAVEQRLALGTLRSFVGFSRTHRDGARALQAFERGMRRIAATGELARITRTWAQRARVKANAS